MKEEPGDYLTPSFSPGPGSEGVPLGAPGVKPLSSGTRVLPSHSDAVCLVSREEQLEICDCPLLPWSKIKLRLKIIKEQISGNFLQFFSDLAPGELLTLQYAASSSSADPAQLSVPQKPLAQMDFAQVWLGKSATHYYRT